MSDSPPLKLLVEQDNVNVRLDVFLTAAIGAEMSRAGLQRLIKNGFVTRMEAARVEERNPARKVRLGEMYYVDIPAAEASELIAEDIPLTIVYEDKDLLVIDKPAGLTVHPAPGNYTGTLVQALLHHCGNSLSGINGEARPGIVHRIDKDTSGLLVVAKHDVAHRGLAKQFARHDIHRKYLALVRGVPLRRSGTIEGDIGRNPANRMKRAVVADGTGKRAVTHYRVVEIFESAAMIECQLETGRTHQIRVHMSHIGHPLLGDPLYGKNTPLKGVGDLQLPPRQLLHAAELGFVHPVTQEDLMFESRLPDDILAVAKRLRGM